MKSKQYCQKRPSILVKWVFWFTAFLFAGQYGAFAQVTPVSKGNLPENNGNQGTINYLGQAEDYIIPANTTYTALYFQLWGGDGGKREFTVLSTCTQNGGQAASGQIYYAIGQGSNQLVPGSTLRFVVGGHGKNITNFGTEGAGGGGGTAILYKQRGSATWEILAVAGGGGGASADGFCGGQSGYGGNAGENGDTGGADGAVVSKGDGGTNGNGGKYAGGLMNGCGGGGAISDGGGQCQYKNYCAGGGEQGEWLGGLGGAGGSVYDLTLHGGGYGFGGGGSGDASGGGGGVGLHGGGGGGSYASSKGLLPIFHSGGTTNNPSHGKIHYQFLSGVAPSPATMPVSKPIRTNEHIVQSYDQQIMPAGDGIVLQNGPYELIINSHGNLVLVQLFGFARKVLWYAFDEKLSLRNMTLVFQYDGNLVIYGDRMDGPKVIYGDNSAVWASGTADNQQGGKGGQNLVLMPDGNLTITNVDGKVIWQTNTGQ
jgi:hypothetical protein